MKKLLIVMGLACTLVSSQNCADLLGELSSLATCFDDLNYALKTPQPTRISLGSDSLAKGKVSKPVKSLKKIVVSSNDADQINQFFDWLFPIDWDNNIYKTDNDIVSKQNDLNHKDLNKVQELRQELFNEYKQDLLKNKTGSKEFYIKKYRDYLTDSLKILNSDVLQNKKSEPQYFLQLSPDNIKFALQEKFSADNITKDITILPYFTLPISSSLEDLDKSLAHINALMNDKFGNNVVNLRLCIKNLHWREIPNSPLDPYELLADLNSVL